MSADDWKYLKKKQKILNWANILDFISGNHNYKVMVFVSYASVFDEFVLMFWLELHFVNELKQYHLRKMKRKYSPK